MPGPQQGSKRLSRIISRKTFQAWFSDNFKSKSTLCCVFCRHCLLTARQMSVLNACLMSQANTVICFLSLIGHHFDDDGCSAGNNSRQYRTCRADVQQDALTAGPDISWLDPVLQKQWDHAANQCLGDVIIKPYSNRKVWWQCDQCPDGHPHSWFAVVSNRSNGAGCPQCSGRLVCKHNSLRTKAPLGWSWS